MKLNVLLVYLTILIFPERGWTQQKHKHVGSKICANRQFRKDRVDIYDYVGVVENGIAGTTNNVTKIKITAKVSVINWESCDFYMKIEDVQIYESLGSKDNYIKLTSNELSAALSAYPLRFKMKNGMVTEINPSVESTQANVLNIQRGILSMLQIRKVQKGNFEKIDEDVSGRCLTKYVFHVKNGHGIVDENTEHVDKIKDLNSCEGHVITHSNIHGDPYDENGKNPVLQSSSVCSYKLNKKKKLGLKNVVCKENFLVKPFSSESGAGAYVNSRTELIRKKSRKIKQQIIPYNNYYPTTIMYDHNHQHTVTHLSSYKTKVKDLLQTLANTHYHKSNFDSAALFFDLVTSFRHLEKEDILFIIKTLDLEKESIRFFVFDAMAQCGTPSCITTLFSVMNERKLQKEAFRFMPYLAFIKEPTPEVVRMLMNIHLQTKKPNVLLLISSLVHKMCQHRSTECDQTGLIGKVMEDTEYFFLRLLGNNCQTNDLAKQENIFYALKGIGNMGRPTKAVPLIIDCIKNAKHPNMSIAAVQALRRMILTDSIKDLFYEILTDKNEELEKRIEVFLSLMKSPTKADIILARDLAINEEETSQMISFVSSYLRSATKNQDKTKRELTNMFKEVLKEYPLSPFDAPPSQHSTAFLQSVNLYHFAATANGMILFHPESFVPRTMNLNLTAHMFGYSINAFEVNARMEGLEMLIKEHLGPDGVFSNQYMNNVFKIPDEKLGDKARRRRAASAEDYADIDKQINMKQSSPQSLVSLKVFGNEIQIFSLKDIPFLNGRYDDVNLIKELYELTKGKRKTFKQNMILLEVSLSVPTILGFPLKIGVNGSALATLDLQGKVQSSNILFGPKKVLMDGSLEPSISIHASGELSVECIGVGKIGTSFQANMHAGRNLQGQLHYEEGKKLKAHLLADKAINDVLNISYNMFHVASQKKEAIIGDTKKTKGYFCTDDFMNSSVLFGSNTCVEISFPNTYYNATSPYFPLTGPFHLGLRNYPTDPKLKTYQLTIENVGGLYAVSVSTPGATNERKYTIRLGVTKTSGGGVIGTTFGDKKKGIVLSYIYDKKTNGMKTTLTSNFTKMPLTLYGEFFNETDPSTLNRNVGGKFRFSLGNYHVKHKIFYKNTYEYWALGSDLEYSPGKIASLYLKIQYETQEVYLNFTHSPSKTQVLAYALPSLPLVSGSINITHDRKIDIRTYGKIDIQNYEVEGYVLLEPGKQTVNVNGKLNPKDKILSVFGNLNGSPVTWKASLKKEKQSNRIESTAQLAQSILKKTLEWNSSRIYAGASFNGVQSSLLTVLSKSKGEFKVDTNLDFNGNKIMLNFGVKNSSDLHEFCISGDLQISKFAHCLMVYHSKTKKGISVKIRNPGTDMWIFPISLLKIQTKSESILKAEYLKQLSLVFNQSKNSMVVAFNGFGSNVKLEKSIDDYDNTNFLLRYLNGSTNQEVIRYQLGHQKSLIDERLTKFQLKLFHGKALVSSEMFLYVDKTKFKSILNTLDSKDQPRYTMIISNGDINVEKVNMANSQIHFDLDVGKGTVKGIQLEEKDVAKLEIKQENIRGKRSIVLRGRLDSIENQNAKMEDIAVISVASEGDVTYKLITNNSMIKSLSGILKSSQESVVRAIHDKIDNIGTKYFQDLLQLEPKKVEKLMELLKKTLAEYFSTLKCNGIEIKKKFIEGKIKNDELLEIVFRSLEMPYSPAFLSLFQNSTMLKQHKDNLKEFFKAENMLSLAQRFLKERLNKAHGTIQNMAMSKQETNSSSSSNSPDVYEREFLSFVLQIVDVTQKLFKDEITVDELEKHLSTVTKYLSKEVKQNLISVIQDSVRVLRTWKYDTKVELSKNLRMLMERLQKISPGVFLDVDLISVLVNNVLSRSNLPQPIQHSLKLFLRDSSYVNLLSKMSQFALQELKVSGPHPKHVRELLNTRSISDYFRTLSSIVVKRSRLAPKRKEPFEEFLQNLDLKALFQTLKQTLIVNYNVSRVGVAVIDQILHENLKSFLTKGLPSLLHGNQIMTITKKILVGLKEADVHQFIKTAMQILKPDLDLQSIEFMLSTDKTLEEKVLLIYQFLSQESNKHLSTDDKNKTMIFGDFINKFIHLVLTKSMNEKDVAVKGKEMLLFYYDSIIQKISQILPPNWKNALQHVWQKSRDSLAKISADKLRGNVTNAVLDLSGVLYQDVSIAVQKHFATFIKDDLLQWLQHSASTVYVEKETLLSFYKRMFKKMDEFLKFSLRLSGQFVALENNPFAEKYIQNGKLQYYKIYQAMWKEKMLSKQNVQQITELLNGLEKRILEETVKLTGNYSLIPTINNIFNYFKTLNNSDLNSLIDSYKAVNVEHFTNLSYVTLRNHMEALIVDIGKTKHGSLTIDQHVQQALPKILSISRKIYQVVNETVSNQLHVLDVGKTKVSSAFQMVRGYLKQAERNNNKFVMFLHEVFVPGIDGLFSLAYKNSDGKSYPMEKIFDRCAIVFAQRYQFSANISSLTDLLAADKELSSLLMNFQNSSTCDIINLRDKLKNVKKDQNFVYKVLEYLERILLKMLTERKVEMIGYKNLIKAILPSEKQSQNPLRDIVFDTASRIMTTVDKMTVYKNIRRVIRRSISLDSFDANNYFKTILTNELKKIFPKITITQINQHGRRYLPTFVRNVKDNLQNVSFIILKAVDAFKIPLLQHKFITDPYEYVTILPKTLFDLILKQWMKNKNMILSDLYKFENRIRDLFENGVAMLRKQSPHRFVAKLKELYQNATSNFFDEAIRNIEKYDTNMKNEFVELLLGDRASGNLKQRLLVLSRKTKEMRENLAKIQKTMFEELHKNFTNFHGDYRKILNQKLNPNFYSNVDLKMLNEAIMYLSKGVRDIVKDALFPQLIIALEMTDASICQLKTNISNFYSNKDGVHTLSWKSVPFVRNLEKYEKVWSDVVKKMSKHVRKFYSTLEDIDHFKFDKMRKLYETFVHGIASQYINRFELTLRKKANEIYTAQSIYQMYADISPVALVQKPLLAYQTHIKKLAIRVNKAIKIVPPTGFERPILRFLGLNVLGLEEKRLFTPLSRTAYIFERSLVTYDGRAVVLPLGLQTKFSRCKYLLSRDFMWKNFTIYLQNGNFVVELHDGKVVVERNKKNKVHAYTKDPSTGQMKHNEEFPIQMIYTTVTKVTNVLKIQNVFGLLIYCRLDRFSCNVTVSGYYHNKTLGLFGTNNVEYSDDLRMPNGRHALNLLEFLNSYELTGDKYKCVLDLKDVLGNDNDEIRREKRSKQCKKKMKNMNIEKNTNNVIVRTSAFATTCSVEELCPVMSSYVRSIRSSEEVFLSLFSQCGACSEVSLRMRLGQTPKSLIHITLLIKLTPKMERVRDNIKRVLQKIHPEIIKSHDVQYFVVGYNGRGVRKLPHIQTGGGGNVALDISAVSQALNQLEFRGKDVKERLGFSALKFASLMEVQRSIRLFFLFDDDASYTNSLQQMMDIYNILSERSIVLNTVNGYKFKRLVIGKDSFGLRYHVRLPKGESFGSVTFPPPDDYIPLVKNTGGAVFALKAFKSSRLRWQKALGIAISRTVELQVKREGKRCRECKCNICKHVDEQLCQYGL